MPIELAGTLAPPAREGSKDALPSRSAWRRELHLGSRRIGRQERMFFNERLELLLETGVPLHDCLRALESQVGSPALSDVIGELRSSVEGGLSFSQALRRHPQIFPATTVNLIAAGEQGGFLPQVLRRLRELDTRQEELRAALFSAFSYPAFLVVFSALTVLFVLVVVFPKFSDLFGMIRDQLPLTTRFLLALSTFLLAHWAPMLAATVGAAALLWRSARVPAGALAIDRWLMRTPILRDIAVRYQLVQFLHVLSLSLENGVPLLEALRDAREVVAGAGFRRLIEELERRVAEGRGFASGFADARFLPALVPQMMATAEASGSLARVSARVADFYERDLRQKLTLVAKVVEPAMLLVMGVVVGLIVSSLLLPIFKLSTAVR